MIKKETNLDADVALRVLKIGTCPSLSGRSELTYHLGANGDNELHFRVVSNTGSGQFNPDWIAINLIMKLLAEHPESKPLTSSVLRPAYWGKSSNSPAFLFAGLKAEGVVIEGAGKEGSYLLGDIEIFAEAMNALTASDADVADATADKVAKKKPVGRKPSGITAV